MSSFASLSEEERAWLAHDEQLWRKAHEIVRRNPALDVGGVYRVLRNFEKTPTQRLHAALQHGRLFGIYSR